MMGGMGSGSACAHCDQAYEYCSKEENRLAELERCQQEMLKESARQAQQAAARQQSGVVDGARDSRRRQLEERIGREFRARSALPAKELLLLTPSASRRSSLIQCTNPV